MPVKPEWRSAAPAPVRAADASRAPTNARRISRAAPDANLRRPEQVGGAERVGQERRDVGGHAAPSARRVEDGRVACAELREHLAAPAARRRRPVLAADDGDRVDAPVSGGDCHGDRVALRADRQRIRAVLQVAGGEDPAAGEHGCADLESRVRRVGAGAGAAGGTRSSAGSTGKRRSHRGG